MKKQTASLIHYESLLRYTFCPVGNVIACGSPPSADTRNKRPWEEKNSHLHNNNNRHVRMIKTLILKETKRIPRVSAPAMSATTILCACRERVRAGVGQLDQWPAAILNFPPPPKLQIKQLARHSPCWWCTYRVALEEAQSPVAAAGQRLAVRSRARLAIVQPRSNLENVQDCSVWVCCYLRHGSSNKRLTNTVLLCCCSFATDKKLGSKTTTLKQEFSPLLSSSHDEEW